MNSLEELSEKVEERKPRRDGEKAIPVFGHCTERDCDCGCNRSFEIPDYILNDDGEVKKEYRHGVWLPNGVFVGGRELSNGVFISENGSCYYKLECWSGYCADC